MLERILELVRRKRLCALATTDGITPHCSLMAYVPDESACGLVMVTRASTRKYRNLEANPKASVLIDTRDEMEAGRPFQITALTAAGEVSLHEPASEVEALGRFLDTHPDLTGLTTHPEARVLRLRVKSFLLLDGVGKATYLEVPDPKKT
jgi:hypothetical protein